MTKPSAYSRRAALQAKRFAATARLKLMSVVSEEARLESMVGPPGRWNDSQIFQIRFLKQVGLMPHHRFLDVGCGPLRGGIPIINYLDSGCYVGLDVRPTVIREAYRQIARHDLAFKNPRLVVSTTFGGEELHGMLFDVIWAFSVLIHLSDDLVDEFFTQTSALAKSCIYANVNTAIAPRLGQWKGFPFVQRSLDFYDQMASTHGFSVRDCGQLIDFGCNVEGGKTHHMLQFNKA